MSPSSKVPTQHITNRNGRSYVYIMPELNKTPSNESNRNLLIETTIANSQVGRANYPISAMVQEENNTLSFFDDATNDITAIISNLMSQQDPVLTGQANVFSAQLTKLNEELASYKDEKDQAEQKLKKLRDIQPQTTVDEDTYKNESQIVTDRLKALSIQYEELKKGFEELKIDVESIRRPIIGLRPD